MSLLLDPAPAVNSDTFRVVSFTGNRAVLILDLNDQVNYVRDRDAGITFTPAPPSVQYSRRSRRYGGARPVGVTHDNATLQWTAYVKGASYGDIAAHVEALAQQIDDVTTGTFVQWTPQGGMSSYLEIAGPGTWIPAYNPVELSQVYSMRYAISQPVLPLVRWDPMTITDGIGAAASGSYVLTDYTFDAMVVGDLAVNAAGYLTGLNVLTTERRVRHTARGYTALGGEATAIGTPNTTITSYKQGVILRASNSLNYVEAYVDDNATNSRLRIDVIAAGVRTNRASTNLGARMTTGAKVGVKARIEGNVVTAEHFIAAAISADDELFGTATTTNTYTLAGAEITLPAGSAGFSWIPQNSSAQLRAFRYCPHVRRDATLPATFTFFSATAAPAVPPLPGRAPALVDVGITPSGGSLVPAWAQVAWADYADTSTNPPFGLMEAETGSNLVGWASSVQAGGHGGNDLRATTAGAVTYTANWPIDLSTFALDDFTDGTTGTVDLEVWARTLLTSTLVNPRMVTSFTQGTSLAGQRFTAEYGTVGKLLTLPSAGTVYRASRLGTLTVTRQAAAGGSVFITATADVGSTGAYGLDYLWLVPTRRRALGPTGVALDATYPQFVPDTGAWTKRVRTDLSGEIRKTSTGTGARVGDHGLSGSLIEIDPGTPKVWLKLSSEVPDDPTVDASTEQLAHTATLQLDVTPRSLLLREA